MLSPGNKTAILFNEIFKQSSLLLKARNSSVNGIKEKKQKTKRDIQEFRRPAAKHSTNFLHMKQST